MDLDHVADTGDEPVNVLGGVVAKLARLVAATPSRCINGGHAMVARADAIASRSGRATSCGWSSTLKPTMPVRRSAGGP